LNEGVEMVMWVLDNALGGEIFVPKIPSYRVMDLAEAIGPECEKKIIGVRPGEKVHEEMITASDSANTWDLEKYFAILPSGVGSQDRRKGYYRKFEKMPGGFSYNSGSNSTFLSVPEIRALIKEHVSKHFSA